MKSVEAFVEHQQQVLTQVRDALSASQDAMEGYINDDSRKTSNMHQVKWCI